MREDDRCLGCGYLRICEAKFPQCLGTHSSPGRSEHEPPPASNLREKGAGEATSTDAILCPYCGGENRATDSFCRECGRSLNPKRIRTADEFSAQPRPRTPVMRSLLPRRFGIASIALFFLGVLVTVVVHESVHVMLVEHFGGIVWSIRILGFVVYPAFDPASFSWKGDIADVEGFFPTLPPESDLWLAHWMPEVIGLLSVALISVVFVKGSVSDNPMLFAFLLGVLATDLLGLICVAMSFL